MLEFLSRLLNKFLMDLCFTALRSAVYSHFHNCTVIVWLLLVSILVFVTIAKQRQRILASWVKTDVRIMRHNNSTIIFYSDPFVLNSILQKPVWDWLLLSESFFVLLIRTDTCFWTLLDFILFLIFLFVLCAHLYSSVHYYLIPAEGNQNE